jgi:ubiquinone/menaquinone biosynthesis C-methylase UbiE
MKTYFKKAAPKWRSYRQKRAYYNDSITKYIDYFTHPQSSVLEVGCATGELIEAVKGNRKVGIDFCEELIEQARQTPSSTVTYHVMAAEEIDPDRLGGEPFDVIVISNLIGFLSDIEHVLTQLQKVCHRHTRIIIASYNRLWEPLIAFAELIGIKRKTPTQNWISRADLKNMLYLAGFETYRCNSSMLLPFNIPLIAPLFNRILSHLPLFDLISLNHYFFARPMPKVERQYSVTVLVPARNEAGNIRHAVERIPDMGSHTEIIFCEGNSTDNTWEVIEQVQKEYEGKRDIKICRQTGKGKGDAVRCGYSIATGDVLMILDADLTVSPEDLPKFYKAIASGKGEFINGVRLVYPMESGAMRTLNTIGNHFFSKLFSWILEMPIKDTLCGTKVMFRRDWERLTEGRKFFGEFDPFGDFDMLFGAHKLNLKIIDLPVRYKERKYGDTNISRFSHGLLLLKMSTFATWKIKFK